MVRGKNDDFSFIEILLGKETLRGIEIFMKLELLRVAGILGGPGLAGIFRMAEIFMITKILRLVGILMITKLARLAAIFGSLGLTEIL